MKVMLKIKISTMKQKENRKRNGFTLIELLAVISILGLVMSFVALNLNRLRGPRNVKIVTSQLITQIRRIQSYSLSSHNTPSGVPAKYYLLTIPSLNSKNYTISAIDQNLNLSPVIDTVNLPEGIMFSLFKAELPSGSPVSPDPGCIQIAFGLPFGKMYVDTDRDADGVCDMRQYLQSPPELTKRSNSLLRISIKDPVTNSTKIVALYGIAGKIQEE